MRRFYLIIIIIVISCIAAGCPHSLVKHLDENYQQGVYKPAYLTAKSKNRFSAISQREGKDSSFSDLIFEIRSINSTDFPNRIEIKAIVFDSSGHFITGLAPPHTRDSDYLKYWTPVLDSCNGAVDTITDFSVKEFRKDAAEPLAITYILDHSGSMSTDKLNKLQYAMYKMFQITKAGDFVSIARFGERNYIDIELNNTPKKFLDSLKQRYGNYVDLGGGTAMFDGLIAGIEELRKAPSSHSKVVILFSDGMDNKSKSDYDKALLISKKNNIKIFTIYLGLGLARMTVLKKLSDNTGGKFYHILFAKEFPFVFADIYLKLNNYYKITYTPPNCESLHKVRLSLNPLKNKEVIIHADGFYDKSVINPQDPIGTVSFLNIEFEFGKAEIKPNSVGMIRKVAEAMQANASLAIRINGHTDNIGSEKDNLTLSEDRAFAVKQMLIEMGISGDSIETIGYGESRPIGPNNSEENRRKNRRTEFEIIAK